MCKKFMVWMAAYWGIWGLSATARAEDPHANELEQLLELSIEQLLDVKVFMPAAITHFSLAEMPASVTVITADDIAGSTARNIYDLIEIYVPGAIWMIHEKGPHPGVRGIITNQNYKYLLIVNGRVLNNKGYFGAKTELEMWDLGDIRRIEVIRGPGSVTYGPGAIAGVIHIVTFNGQSDQKPTVSGSFVSPYQSTGLSYSQTGGREDFRWYGYASTRETKGIKPRQFGVTSANEAGYVGSDIRPSEVPLDYFGDFEEPQVKLHWDLNYGKNWRFWLRYTQQGAPWASNETKSLVADKYVNQQSTRERQATAFLEHSLALSSELTLLTQLSFDSMDTEGRKDRLDDPDPDHPLNYRVNFAEHEILLHNRLNWVLSPKTEYSLGMEIAKDYYVSGWGDHKRSLRLGEGGNIVSGADSEAIRAGNRGSADRNNNAFYVGNGWETSTYSLFSEANHEWAEGQRVLLSIRADKNTYTDWMLSPRLAFISRLNARNILKLIVQRSVRMNTAGQIYTEVASGKDSSNERLDGAELIYGYYTPEQEHWQLSLFRNRIRAIGFEGDANLTKPLGTLDLYGLEIEWSRRRAPLTYGLNYSYVKQLSWSLASGESSSGTSYSDYQQDLDGVTQLGFGNDLNNWPNHAIKGFGRVPLTASVSMQGDARVFWHWQGAKDGMSGLVRALDGDQEQERTKQTVQKLLDRGVYGPEYRFGLSLSWQASPALHLALFTQNPLNMSENRRYAYDSGNDSKAPERVRFVEEPRLFGARISWQIL